MNEYNFESFADEADKDRYKNWAKKFVNDYLIQNSAANNSERLFKSPQMKIVLPNFPPDKLEYFKAFNVMLNEKYQEIKIKYQEKNSSALLSAITYPAIHLQIRGNKKTNTNAEICVTSNSFEPYEINFTEQLIGNKENPHTISANELAIDLFACKPPIDINQENTDPAVYAIYKNNKKNYENRMNTFYKRNPFADHYNLNSNLGELKKLSTNSNVNPTQITSIYDSKINEIHKKVLDKSIPATFTPGDGSIPNAPSMSIYKKDGEENVDVHLELKDKNDIEYLQNYGFTNSPNSITATLIESIGKQYLRPKLLENYSLIENDATSLGYDIEGAKAKKHLVLQAFQALRALQDEEIRLSNQAVDSSQMTKFYNKIDKILDSLKLLNETGSLIKDNTGNIIAIDRFREDSQLTSAISSAIKILEHEKLSLRSGTYYTTSNQINEADQHRFKGDFQKISYSSKDQFGTGAFKADDAKALYLVMADKYTAPPNKNIKKTSDESMLYKYIWRNIRHDAVNGKGLLGLLYRGFRLLPFVDSFETSKRKRLNQLAQDKIPKINSDTTSAAERNHAKLQVDINSIDNIKPKSKTFSEKYRSLKDAAKNFFSHQVEKMNNFKLEEWFNKEFSTNITEEYKAAIDETNHQTKLLTKKIELLEHKRNSTTTTNTPPELSDPEKILKQTLEASLENDMKKIADDLLTEEFRQEVEGTLSTIKQEQAQNLRVKSPNKGPKLGKREMEGTLLKLVDIVEHLTAAVTDSLQQNPSTALAAGGMGLGVALAVATPALMAHMVSKSFISAAQSFSAQFVQGAYSQAFTGGLSAMQLGQLTGDSIQNFRTGILSAFKDFVVEHPELATAAGFYIFLTGTIIAKSGLHNALFDQVREEAATGKLQIPMEALIGTKLTYIGAEFSAAGTKESTGLLKGVAHLLVGVGRTIYGAAQFALGETIEVFSILKTFLTEVSINKLTTWDSIRNSFNSVRIKQSDMKAAGVKQITNAANINFKKAGTYLANSIHMIIEACIRATSIGYRVANATSRAFLGGTLGIGAYFIDRVSRVGRYLRAAIKVSTIMFLSKFTPIDKNPDKFSNKVRSELDEMAKKDFSTSKFLNRTGLQESRTIRTARYQLMNNAQYERNQMRLLNFSNTISNYVTKKMNPELYKAREEYKEQKKAYNALIANNSTSATSSNTVLPERNALTTSEPKELILKDINNSIKLDDKPRMQEIYKLILEDNISFKDLKTIRETLQDLANEPNLQADETYKLKRTILQTYIYAELKGLISFSQAGTFTSAQATALQDTIKAFQNLNQFALTVSFNTLQDYTEYEKVSKTANIALQNFSTFIDITNNQKSYINILTITFSNNLDKHISGVKDGKLFETTISRESLTDVESSTKSNNSSLTHGPEISPSDIGINLPQDEQVVQPPNDSALIYEENVIKIKREAAEQKWYSRVLGGVYGLFKGAIAGSVIGGGIGVAAAAAVTASLISNPSAGPLLAFLVPVVVAIPTVICTVYGIFKGTTVGIEHGPGVVDKNLAELISLNIVNSFSKTITNTVNAFKKFDSWISGSKYNPINDALKTEKNENKIIIEGKKPESIGTFSRIGGFFIGAALGFVNGGIYGVTNGWKKFETPSLGIGVLLGAVVGPAYGILRGIQIGLMYGANTALNHTGRIMNNDLLGRPLNDSQVMGGDSIINNTRNINPFTRLLAMGRGVLQGFVQGVVFELADFYKTAKSFFNINSGTQSRNEGFWSGVAAFIATVVVSPVFSLWGAAKGIATGVYFGATSGYNAVDKGLTSAIKDISATITAPLEHHFRRPDNNKQEDNTPVIPTDLNKTKVDHASPELGAAFAITTEKLTPKTKVFETNTNTPSFTPTLKGKADMNNQTRSNETKVRVDTKLTPSQKPK